MKIRNGFVSNSSSSSFICEVCGQDASGYDMCLSDAEMYECVNGHIFCESHALPMGEDKEFCISLVTGSLQSAIGSLTKDPSSKYYKEQVEESTKLLERLNSGEETDYDSVMSDYEFRYEFPEQYCPICQMQHVTDNDMVAYLLKKNSVTRDSVISEMKSTFPTDGDLQTFIK